MISIRFDVSFMSMIFVKTMRTFSQVNISIHPLPKYENGLESQSCYEDATYRSSIISLPRNVKCNYSQWLQLFTIDIFINFQILMN